MVPGAVVEPGLGGNGVGGVVAVGEEAVGGVAAGGDLLGKWAGSVGGAKVILQRAEAACAGTGDHAEAWGGRAGEEVDGAADGVRPVEGGAGAVQHVDAGDGVERDGDVEIQVAGFGIVDAEAVDQDEGLLEGGAANGEVGLDAFAGAGLDVERGIGAEEVDGVVGAGG